MQAKHDLTDMKDKEVTCKECNRIFVIRSSELESFSARKKPIPQYCPLCYKRYRAERAAERKQREDLEWQEKKAQEVQRYHDALKDLQSKFDILPLEKVTPDPVDKVLYVIGNGFDLMHGVRSSYYDFDRTLGKRSHIRFVLENYLQVDDLWADFEGALAKINVEAMSQPYILDNHLDAMGAYDEDAPAADFFAAAEMAASPATELPGELDRSFTKWIDTLRVHTDDRPLKGIIRDGRFLDFNYTEFIEDLYGVPRKDVCYIHGCRRKRRGNRREKLILGHQPQASEPQFDFESNWKGLDLSGNRAQMIYDAQQIALREIGEADEDLTKHCDEIIAAHKGFFEGLSDIDTVITIGHSLYPVDLDYFAEAMKQNADLERINWYFGCFSYGDLERIQDFVRQFHIHEDRVHIFRTDTISVTLHKDHAEAPKVSEQSEKSETSLPVTSHEDNADATKASVQSVKSETSENKAERHENPTLREQVIGHSEDGYWKVYASGQIVVMRDRHGSDALTRIFYEPMNGAVFADQQTCFLVMRGVYKGIFLLRLVDRKWTYMGELEEILHQGVINKRLHKILMDHDKITFVYHSRVRIYDLTNGALIASKAVRNAENQRYEGKDLTEQFLKIYTKGF